MTKYIDADAVLHAIEGMREAEWAKQKYFIPNDISAKAILDAVEDTVNYEIPAANVTPVRHGEWLNANHTLIVTCSCYSQEWEKLKNHYEMSDSDLPYLAKQQLEKIGVNLDEWEKEN